MDYFTEAYLKNSEYNKYYISPKRSVSELIEFIKTTDDKFVVYATLQRYGGSVLDKILYTIDTKDSILLYTRDTIPRISQRFKINYIINLL